MKKKYNPEKVQLSELEQNIEDRLNYKNLKKPTSARTKELRLAAKETLKSLKDERANIRMNSEDMNALRQKASEAGMPYQTFIAHIIHLFLRDKLVNVNEVKKMIDAGVIPQRKTGT